MCSAHLPGQPSLLAFDSNANVLYVAGNGAALVTALSPADCSVQHTYHTDSPVNSIAVTIFALGTAKGNSNQLWVAGTNALTIFDVKSGRLLGRVPIAGGPQSLSIPPGSTVYVTTRQGGIDAVDIATRQVQQLLSGGTFGLMDYDALTGEVYVPDEQHNRLDILAPVNSGTTTFPKEPERILSTGAPPASVCGYQRWTPRLCGLAWRHGGHAGSP